MDSPRGGGTIQRPILWYRVFVLCCAVLLTAATLAAGAPGRSAAASARHTPSSGHEASTRHRASAQHATPKSVAGMPGTPQPPTPVFSEDFENRQGNLPVRLDDYTGATGMTYTADPPWLQNCNGWIAAFQDPNGASPSVSTQVADCAPAAGGPGSSGATAWNRVRQLSQSLGILNGTTDPNTNHAVSAYTNGRINNGDPGPNYIEFQTADPITVPDKGRFLTFSVNAAETSCTASHNHALLNYFLVDGATSIPVNNEPIEPCNSGTEVSSGFFAGTFAGDAPVLWTSDSLGIVMRNAQGSGNGNDHAFDDIRLLDVTPQLDKSFSPDTVDVGGTSTLTLTITNTDDLFAKDGWSFTDTLPDGLTLATPANAETDCPAGAVTADDGGSVVSVSGGALNAGQASCTVTVDVTSSTAGTYTDDASNITDSTGVNPPGRADVTFVSRQTGITLEKSADPTSFSASGQLITYTYRVTNTGEVALNDVGVTDDLDGLSAVDCPRSTLAPDESQDCTATYRTTQEDVDRGSIHNVATAHGTPEGATEPVVSNPSDVTVHAATQPAITVRKSVSPTTFRRAGQVLHYSYTVTNTGDVRLTDVRVEDSHPGVSEVSCPSTTLDPGESQACTATYTTTAEDVRAKVVRDSAVAHGNPPGSDVPVTSEPSTATAHLKKY